jgi:membrane-bound metal-dependent hydrolase YbcI (DUF457 family)
VLAGGGAVLLALATVAVFGLGPPDEERPSSLAGLLAVGAAVGYLSHLLLDSMARQRIRLLLPGGRRVGWGRMRPRYEIALLVGMPALLAVWLPAALLPAGVPR